MRIVSVFCFILFQQALIAQKADSIKIIGQVVADSGATLMPGKAELRLVPYTEDENVTLATVNSDGRFTIKVAVKTTGLYNLKYKNYTLGLLLSPAEPVYTVTIKTDAKQEVKGMKIGDSNENDAYRKFKRENIGLHDLLRDLKTECNANEAACLAKFKKQTTAHNDLMDYLKLRYKGTFTGAVLAASAKVPDLNNKSSVLSQMQSSFFNDVDFADTMLYRTPDLNNKISLYLDYIADTSANNRLAFIHSLLNKTKGKTEAQKALLTLLFNNFLDEYREPYIASLIQWASNQKSLSTDQPLLAAKIKLVANVIPGLPAPDVTGENVNQQPQTLLNTARVNKLTLLIFWESDCPHCRKAMPGFVSLYKQYHPKGLEVFAASLDTDKNKWKQFIATNHLTWQNIVLPDNSSTHSDYFIQYTPTVVLIDSKGKIIHRFISVDDLEFCVAAILNK